MKKVIIVVSLCLAVFFIAFRLKDDKMVKPLPEGFWRGYWNLYNAAVLNRNDGTSRLYLLFSDDTSAAYKYDGEWHTGSSAFVASYPYDKERLYMEGSNNKAGIMKGKSTHKTMSGASFIFVKEP